MPKPGPRRYTTAFGRVALIGAGVFLLEAVIFWAMGHLMWSVVPVIVAVVLCVLGVVLTRMGGHGTDVRGNLPDELDQPDAEPEPQIPIECQPVAPADQAEGFGWMKASDLANQRKKP